MSLLKRATTWEISESEGESDSEIKSTSTSAVPKIDGPVTPNSQKIVKANNDETEKCNAAARSCETQNLRDTLPLPSTAVPSTPSPGKRRRRTKEEIDADKLNLEQKKKDREKFRNEKAQEKEKKRQEQQQRKQDAERLKCYRPENCLKSLTVCIDAALLQDERSDILLGSLYSMEWKITIEEQQLLHSITWRRELPEGEDKPSPVLEEQVLMVLTLNDFLDMVVSIKHDEQKGFEVLAVDSLFKQLSEYLNRNGEKVVTLAVMGPNPNSWTLCSQQHGDQMLSSQMGEEGVDIEEALVFLQLYRNTSVIFLESWQGLTDHVCAITKALSKRPFKQLTEKEYLPFCLDGSWASGVRVEKDGTGLSQVWSRQIQQLNRVSPAVAAGVSSAFPSPQLLLKAYKDLGSEGERKGLLADLSVKSGERERRVGPEISNRVYRFLTAQNPQLVLD
ncbi:hypothetical protein SKAU_G00130430 [Synaphobranchus kaupii]|uniref:ERCC4 domain-containing protein n=1 Tax=Synaphobranchus kaupii TaxID=118154 RepID=A0A9Q1FRA1_SYNKA|nr:hypothetical protein SKAU_G00130430 [Synaphobranchus kaupii]